MSNGNRIRNMFSLIGGITNYLPFIIQNALRASDTMQLNNVVHRSGGPAGRMVGKRRRLTCRPITPGNPGSRWPDDMHTPKHLRQPQHPKFNGKGPAMLSKQQLSWMRSHLLPGGKFDTMNCPGSLLRPGTYRALP